MRTRFVSCDWGTSNFRLRLIDGDWRISREHRSDSGIQSIAATHAAGDARTRALEDVLQTGIDALGLREDATVPVVISGMASSTLGFRVLPYAALPAPVDGRSFVRHEFALGGRRVVLISGLRDESDVMRGEETEIVGLFAERERRAFADNGMLLLPGTHSKHVRLRGGNIVGFRTYLTGELYALLTKSSTLRPPDDAQFDDAAFRAGVHASREFPLTAALFQTRARNVLGSLPARNSGAFLSGVLIGSEVQQIATDAPLLLAATGTLGDHYRSALSELHPKVPLTSIGPDESTRATIAAHRLFLG